MNRLFTTFLFFSLAFHAITQRIAAIPGEYTYEEKIGLHSDGVPTVIGNNHYWPRDPLADTTVLHKLCLNAAHGAFLERDTSMSSVYINVMRFEWAGKWELSGDSLVVIFDHLITFYPFSLQGLPLTEVESLQKPLVMVYLVDEAERLIHTAGRKEYEFWDFEKNGS